jgi:hypothetical protein
MSLKMYAVATMVYFVVWLALIYIVEVLVAGFPWGLSLVTFLALVCYFPLAFIFWGLLGVVLLITWLLTRR